VAKAANPFKPTAGSNPPLLIGRQDMIDEFTESIEDGPGAPGRITIFTGARGVGKTVLIAPTVDQVITAHAGFLDAVHTGRVNHYGQPGLDWQAVHAGRRTIGNRGGWGWKPVNGAEHVTALEAATIAHLAAATSKRHPGRKTTVSF